MRTVISNICTLLLLAAAVMGLACILPAWASMGVIMILQIINITLSGNVTKGRGEDGKA